MNGINEQNGALFRVDSWGVKHSNHPPEKKGNVKKQNAGGVYLERENQYKAHNQTRVFGIFCARTNQEGRRGGRMKEKKSRSTTT